MTKRPAPWLDDTPGHWTQTLLGHVVNVMGGATPSKENPKFWDGKIPWISPKDMKVRCIDSSEDYVTEAALHASALRLVPRGAILMVTRGMILDHTVPVAITSIPVTINQDMKALLSREMVDCHFLMWLLIGLNAALLARVEEAAHGAKALRTEEWRKLPIALPPLPEQRRVADALYQKTKAIDTLIAKKEQLVAALQEKRQALITNAVTGGARILNLASHLPSQWQTLQLRRVVIHFIDYRGRTPTKVPSGIPLITAGAVRNGRIDHARAPEFMAAEEYEEIMQRGRPEVGDLVFTTEAPLGEVGLVEDVNVAFAQRIILFKVDNRMMDSRFLWLYYLSDIGRAEISSRASGSTAEGIRADRLRGSLVIVPPRDEQTRIVENVEREVRAMQPIESRIASQLVKLREYRQALITAAVTGKIDVTREPATS